ncbi:MAG: laccase domain-containing protein [Clostridia bacterium]|nr:laccase domain-containing protein [Clostridia bacterium]
MFYRDGIIYRSTFLEGYSGIVHGFSARRGGVSTIDYLSSLNLTGGLGDEEENVRANTEIFAKAVSKGMIGGDSAVTAHQIHSAKVRIAGPGNRGEGFSRDRGEDCDGFVTDRSGILPIVRTADCVPILMAGTKPDGSYVIAAVHAGWRGSAGGIAGVAVEKMCELGCVRDTIRAAVGTHIRQCCYEVRQDFVDSVSEARDPGFAARHIARENGKYRADLAGMNLEILNEAGVSPDRVDVSPFCTACRPDEFFSHRASGGKRGTMGAGIAIISRT